MSFVIQYHPFVNLTVEEEGTGTGMSAFSFRPTYECEHALANQKMVFRPRDQGFQIFYQKNPMVPDALLGPITSRVRFSFAVHLNEQSLFETHEPDLNGQTGPQLYLDNLTAGGNIQSKDTLTASTVIQATDASRVYPPVFQAAADLSVPGPPTAFRVLDKFNPATTVLSEPITSTVSGPVSIKIDLSGKPSGPYTLATDAASPPARTIYIDEALARSGVFGVLDIYWETRQDTVPANGLDYFIRLRPR